MKKAKQFLVILMTGIMIFTGTSLGGFGTPSYAAEDQDNAVVQQDESTDSIGQTDENADMEESSDTEEDSNADTGAVSDAENNASSDAEVENAGKYQLQSEIKLSDDSKWQITAVYDEKAGIPENAELTIEEIDAKDSADYLKEIAKALKWADNDQAAYSRFLNISITSKGKNVKPSADVLLIIKSKDVEKNIDAMQVVRFDENKSGEIVKTEEIECTATEDKKLELLTDKCEVFGFVVVESTEENADPENTENKENDDPELVEKTLKAGKVRLEGMMPEDAKATATDATDTKEVKSIESDNGTALAAYDITINAGGDEYQPDEDNPINVQISNKAIKEDSYLSIWHLKDDGTKEEVKDFTVEDGKVLFDATGFSVYVVIDHEGGIVENPRVQFHFIANDAKEYSESGTVYYEGSPYEFKNKGVDNTTDPATNYNQTTQILKNGETLELITDPENDEGDYFYGWYVVDPYVISGTTDDNGIDNSGSKLYYTWPNNPKKISFEKEITITGTDVSIGNPVSWSLNGVNGSGSVDKDGNVHVFLAPLYKNYIFANFMLLPRNSTEMTSGSTGLTSSNNVMTRKMISLGSASTADVKVSDIRASSKDPIHLIFIGWEYNAGTEESPNWITTQTVDYTGAEMKDSGKDGVYVNVDPHDASSVDFYPIFVEARWVDYYVGESGSGATYVASGFRESWGADPDNPPEEMTEKPDTNIYTSLQTSTRTGYTFDGWYAFANVDDDGNITNLRDAEDVEVSYITGSSDNYQKKTVTVNTKAVKIADSNGRIEYSGTCYLTANGYTGTIGSSGSIALFGSGTTADSLKFYNGLDRLSLTANWKPDDSRITVIYWTENAQEKGYTAPAAGKEKDDYTASAVKVITTEDLTEQLGSQYASGKTLTLSELQNYQDNSVSVLAPAYLDDVGAVLAGEEKFYGLESSLSDASVIIKGDGSTVYNVYFERLTFKLVFHIGRDHYVKNSGNQKPGNTSAAWLADPNWIEYMFKDSKVTELLGRDGQGGSSYYSKTGNVYNQWSMTYGETTYDSSYNTTPENIKGDYNPDPNDENDQNLYIIEAKYGAYIGDKWPTPSNRAFSFTDRRANDNKVKTLYIWAAYYGSRYAAIANARSTVGNSNGNNPDINGVYEYMSEELCADREGTGLINENRVHHLVAYFGEASNEDRYKQYHILIEAIDGTYDPSVTLKPGSDYAPYKLTTWSEQEQNNIAQGEQSAFVDITTGGSDFYESNGVPMDSPAPVISNLVPKFQLGWELDGYDLIYSCYDPDPHPNAADSSKHDYHIYFFYTPKQYTLTFNIENNVQNDTYYYTQPLAGADKYTDLITVPEGYYFAGWYTNAEGVGDPFDFSTAKMPAQNIVLYPIVKALQYSVKIDPNGGIIDHRENKSTATYFNANYGTPIGEYSVERNYIKLTQKELTEGDPTYYEGDKYYYINTQRLGIPSEGDWGLPTEVRNAVYVKESDIDTYYDWYVSQITGADPEYWTGISVLTKDKFLEAYADFPYRPIIPGAEHYSFMGWYQVFDDGSEASMPYNFNDPVKGNMELRAKWRLDGGYYVQYEPCFYAEEGETVTEIVGEQQPWTDPAEPMQQLYADQALTQIMRAPANTTSGWVFRGWRVVKANGIGTYTDPDTHETKTYTIWEPIELDSGNNPVYYQPGDAFVVDSDLVSENGSYGAIIHMQAYYEKEEDTYRFPDVTNLKLDANDTFGGYVDPEAGALPALIGPGSTAINTDSELDSKGRPTQILFGDIQSNLALHLYRYGTTKKFNDVTGTQFFKNKEGYLLLGFDESEDPEHPETNMAYIPTYASDAVVSVQRKDRETLYAMWEPMVYATFVNTTGEDITIELSGTGETTVSIVNKVTGEFDREQSTTTITVPAKSGDKNGEVKVVFPGAVAGTDQIIASATNNHLGKKLSVSGQFRDTIPYGEGTAAHGAFTGVPFGESAVYDNAVLQTDPEGIIVTYTEIPDNKVNFDVNQGTWTETNTNYVNVSGDLYSIDEYKIENNNYRPADPTRSGKVFVGWTTNADIAACTDFSSTDPVTFGTGDSAFTITPAAGSNVLDEVKRDYLWDFSQDPPFDKVLYAVWSDAVTVTFDVLRTGNSLHTWMGPATTDTNAPYEFYRMSTTSSTITYTLAKGERVPKPSDPTTNQTGWSFVAWLQNNESRRNTTKNPSDTTIVSNTYDFSERVLTPITLSTSWTKTEPQIFTFTVENHVTGDPYEEFTYTIAVSNEKVFGKIGNNNTNTYGDPDEHWGSVTTTLKNNETYTIQIKVLKSTKWTPNTYSVEIDVIDREGNVIKSDHVINCRNNRVDSDYSGINYSSDYKYILTVVQDAKPGYETEVEVQGRNNVDVPPEGYDETSNPERRYTFASINCGTSSQASNFSPPTNEYTGNEANSLTIVYTNTAPMIAPTGFNSITDPFTWLMIFGLALAAWMAYRRRRLPLLVGDDADVEEALEGLHTVRFEDFDWNNIKVLKK